MFKFVRKYIKIFLLVITVSNIIIITSCEKGDKDKKGTLVFADASTVWWLAPTIIAKKHNLFSKYGLEVRTFNVYTGLASKNAVVAGTADVGMVASTPLAMGAYKKEPVLILCSYVESKDLIAILTKTKEDEEIKEPIAIVPATISEFYLFNYLKDRRYLEKRKIIYGDLKTLNGRPPDIPNFIRKGDANTAVIWEPYATIIKDEHKQEIKETREPLYTLRLYLITRPDVWQKKKEELKSFVDAVKEACEIINDSPDKTRHELEDFYNYEEGWLKERFNKVDFSIKKDVEKMKELILIDANISIKLGRIKYKEEPNINHLFEILESPDW